MDEKMKKYVEIGKATEKAYENNFILDDSNFAFYNVEELLHWYRREKNKK